VPRVEHTSGAQHAQTRPDATCPIPTGNQQGLLEKIDARKRAATLELTVAGSAQPRDPDSFVIDSMAIEHHVVKEFLGCRASVGVKFFSIEIDP
jgi:hypothetical protein